MNKPFCFLMLTLTHWFLTSASAAPHATKQDKPNVILIMADDVSWECFGSYGSKEYKTPHIDALAAQGIQFDNCYSQPICTPSRVKIMTGMYNFRNYTHFGYLNPKDRTFGHMMQEAGYKTAIAGKWQLNGLYHKAEDSKDNNRPFKAGFDEYCLWQVTTGRKKADGGTERFWSPMLEQNGTILTEEENHEKYGPDIMSDFVCDFIERNHDDPFFVYYPTVLVHDPFVRTPDTIGDEPKDFTANKAPKNPAAQKENFVAMVNYFDKLVGKIVKKVDELGQLENTIILITADNGTNVRITSRWNGQDIKGGKGGTTDMGTHVPFVAYWKGQTPKGAKLNHLIDFTDFYATLADITGTTPPSDGHSFLSQLRGKKSNSRDWSFIHYQPYWGKHSPHQFARNQNYKLYQDGRFYNIPNDLKEETDLASDSTNKQIGKIRKELRAVLNSAPPPPANEIGRNIVGRPTYPDWKDVGDPND